MTACEQGMTKERERGRDGVHGEV